MTQKGRRAEGPVLALAFLGFLAAVGGVILGLAVGSQPVRGLCLLILGVGILAARREVAEVAAGLNPGPPTGSWVDAYFLLILSLIGIALVIAGVVLLGGAAF
jgi:hypothetical protein